MSPSEQHQDAASLFADIPPNGPGCAAGVMKNGHIVWSAGFGCADMASHRRITADTVFNVASISKQFTAFAILMLMQEGRLSLDDPVQRYVPELRDFAAPVTIRMLLHHTGGLPDYMDSAEALGIEPEDRLTSAEVVAFVQAMTEADNPAGTVYDYSNTGYFLLSLITERISGTSLKTFTERRIMQPLGMQRSTIVDAYPTNIVDLARGYAASDNTYRIDESLWGNTGNGQVHTTVGDLLTWVRNLESGLVGGASLVRQMQEPGTLADGTFLDYGTGLEIGEYHGTRTIGHRGNWAAYNGEMLWFPGRQLSVVILCNFDDPKIKDRMLSLADLFW